MLHPKSPMVKKITGFKESIQLRTQERSCILTFHLSLKPLNHSWSSTPCMGSIIALLMANLSQESPTLTMSAAKVDDGEILPFRDGIDRSEKIPSRLPLYFKLNFDLFPCACMKSYIHTKSGRNILYMITTTSCVFLFFFS